MSISFKKFNRSRLERDIREFAKLRDRIDLSEEVVAAMTDDDLKSLWTSMVMNPTEKEQRIIDEMKRRDLAAESNDW